MSAADNNPILVYRYNDASVPPEYHRSYTICVMPGKVDFSVDVYGTILLRKSFDLKKGAYLSFLSHLSELRIRNREEPSAEPPPGSTSDYLEINIHGNKQVKGDVYSGRAGAGSLEGDVAAAAALFKSLIPDLQIRITKAGK